MPAVPQHHTAVVRAEFDADLMRSRLKKDAEPAYYRGAFAWRDPGLDGSAAAHWAFIHHMVDGDGTIGPANARACLAGIGVLNGGRIGAPGVRSARWFRDRAGIYRHLATHLEDAGMEAPPLADIEAASSADLVIASAGDAPWQVEDNGQFVARFSVFGVVDRNDRVTVETTFEDGAEVLVGAWGHNRESLPSGRGTVRVRDGAAYLEGRFFLNTSVGRDTYETVRALGPLQQWSYVAAVLEARPVEIDGRQATELTRLQLISVDPVDYGANPHTATIAIQGLQSVVRGCADDAEEVLAAIRRRLEVRRRAGRGLGRETADDVMRYAAALRAMADELVSAAAQEQPRTNHAAVIAAATRARARALMGGSYVLHRTVQPG